MEYLIKIVMEATIAYLIGTCLFDIFHYFSHKAAKSRFKFFKKIANLHMIHHRFFYASLKINKTLQRKNLFHHVLVEYSIHLLGILLCLFFFVPLAIILAVLFETGILISVCLAKGMDAHHKPFNRQLKPPKGGIFVNADYHALHHMYPHNYFSSMIKLLDYILGTSLQLQNKRIAMTGANGALGKHMKILLEKEGALVTAFKYGQDYHYNDYSSLEKVLETTDILFLCHGTKYENTDQANCESFIRIIELYQAVKKPTLNPPEIWAVGSEIECHPCFGIKSLYPYAQSKRAFAKQARQYFHNNTLQYRHLVHSAFISPMGPGLMTASFAAKWTLFLLKRGFKYVPVTYTGFALLNYFKFLKPPFKKQQKSTQ